MRLIFRYVGKILHARENGCCMQEKFGFEDMIETKEGGKADGIAKGKIRF